MHTPEIHAERMSMWEYDMARSIHNYQMEAKRTHIQNATAKFHNGEITIQELRDIIIYYSA